MKRRKLKHKEEALKPKAKGKVSGRISRVKKGVRDRKEQEAIAAMDRDRDRDRDTQLLENDREVDVAMQPEVVGRGILEGSKTDELGIRWLEEEGQWWTNVVDDQEVSRDWDSACLPFWDIEFSAEPCESLFADVAWDDHLWNFDVDDGETHPR